MTWESDIWVSYISFLATWNTFIFICVKEKITAGVEVVIVFVYKMKHKVEARLLLCWYVMVQDSGEGMTTRVFAGRVLPLTFRGFAFAFLRN